ncbi:MAG: hypothetical protein EBT33_16815 [Betaproteobacteria bacterium]|nr:hypothetical protein [Betaproteobacteria bacterium]
MNARIAIVLPQRLHARRVSVRKRAFAAGLAIAVLGVSSLASPRAEAGELPLALQGVLSRVAQVHPQMQRARAEAEVSRQQLETARWGRFPSVTVGASAGEGVNAAGSLRIQQPVYTFGRTDHAIDAAQASLEATTSGIDATRRTLLERAAIAHGRWLSGLQQVELALRHVARQQELLEFITRRADGGMAARGDTRLAQGRLEQARARAAALQANVNQARAELESLMMQRIDAPSVRQAFSPTTTTPARFLRWTINPAGDSLRNRSILPGWGASMRCARRSMRNVANWNLSRRRFGFNARRWSSSRPRSTGWWRHRLKLWNRFFASSMRVVEAGWMC